MMKKLATLALTVIFLITIMGGIWSMAYPHERDGLSNYVRPQSSGAFPQNTVPSNVGTIHASPDISIQFTLGEFYTDYGGVIDVTAINDGNWDVFLIAFGFQWTGTNEIYEKQVNLTITSGSTVELGLLSIDGPGSSGEIEYRMLVEVLEKRGNEYYRITAGTDNWVPFEPSTISVMEETYPREYDYRINYYLYFDRTNELITPDSASVTYTANLATTHLGSGYKVSKIAAIFDYVDEILTYRLEPEGTDEWQAPEDCLSTKTGDCEDYSLLIASMVMEIGGTSRMYLIDGHAFAAIYIGNTTDDLENATNSIAAYYNQELKIYHLEDETGYWVVADPLGSFYFGGPPVGAVPISGGEDWGWTFNDTTVVHAIDITGVVESPPVWNNVVFWMYMMFISGVVLILYSTYVSRAEAAKKEAEADTKCQVCQMEMVGIPVICSNCNTRMHVSCLDQGRFCPKCRGMIISPPPPIVPMPVQQPLPPPPPAQQPPPPGQ